ncbi:DUF3152 domain-containing protein [Streptomyces antibioticus]
MGRHSRRGPAPKGAPKGASKKGSDGVGGAGSGAAGAAGTGAASPGRPAGGPPGPYDGTPACGVPRLPDGTPAHGMPRYPDGTPAHGVPRVRGGHPEQREAGGGWGESRGGPAGDAGQPVIPRQRPAPPQGPARSPGPAPSQGPRQDYLDAFDADDDVFTRAGRPYAAMRAGDGYAGAGDGYAGAGDGYGGAGDAYGSPRGAAPRGFGSVAGPYASAPGAGGIGTGLDEYPDPGAPGGPGGPGDGASPGGEPAPEKGAKSRTFTGIAAAAVTTVLAVVVAGQVNTRDDDARSQAAAGRADDRAGRVAQGAQEALESGAPGPSASPVPVTLTYDQKMDATYELSAKLDGSGKFDAVPGIDKAPGKGQKFTYRVDVERGLGLDGVLFAQAVQKTLNDNRSWAHNGARTFERIHSGEPDFVITLASPGTTAEWCAKSGLDTTEDNVSCDSAATERVMINAYRWAQGSPTYGDAIHAYRQMLINHEIGHRLGYSHATCDKDGDLAPVMQQQTKFLDHGDVHCLPNPWAYPKS